MEPKLAASLEGQGGQADVKGIEVPILITGSWSNPRFAPDLASMIQNRDNIETTIESIREDGGKGLIRGLMGQPAQSETGTAGDSTTGDSETPPAETKPGPEDALRQIFGR